MTSWVVIRKFLGVFLAEFLCGGKINEDHQSALLLEDICLLRPTMLLRRNWPRSYHRSHFQSNLAVALSWVILFIMGYLFGTASKSRLFNTMVPLPAISGEPPQSATADALLIATTYGTSVNITKKAKAKRPQLPNVLLIGAQKAGTTAISEWMFGSGSVCKARVFDNEPSFYRKEVTFFNHARRYREGHLFYAKRFEHCSKNYTLSMDATIQTESTKCTNNPVGTSLTA